MLPYLGSQHSSYAPKFVCPWFQACPLIAYLHRRYNPVSPNHALVLSLEVKSCPRISYNAIDLPQNLIVRSQIALTSDMMRFPYDSRLRGIEVITCQVNWRKTKSCWKMLLLGSLRPLCFPKICRMAACKQNLYFRIVWHIKLREWRYLKRRTDSGKMAVDRQELSRTASRFSSTF